MEISVCSVLTSSVGPNIPQIALYTVVRVEVLQVTDLGIADLFGGVEEGVFGAFGREGTLGDVDGAAVSVELLLTTAMVGLELGGG